MKVKHLWLAACLLTGLTTLSCNKNDDDELNSTDRDFMMKASVGNTAETDAANLAVSKASNATVRAFAQRMISEHSMAQTDLKNLGTSTGYTVRDTLDPAHVALKVQLTALSGRQFDSVYMYAQVADHQTAVANFQNEQAGGQHNGVKNYANTYLPHIQMHLTSADSISRAFFRR
jgi:putative membrane protein